MGKGVSPIVASVLMLGIIISLAGSAAIFVKTQQDSVQRRVERAKLSTTNISCTRQTVTWWIKNTAEYGVRDRQADIIFNEDGVPNQTLYRGNAMVPMPLTSGKSRARMFFTLTSSALKPGQDYNLELSTRKLNVEGICTAGTPWWNVNWDYRRRAAPDSSTVSAGDRTHVEINPQKLIQNGKLQPHCQDLRVVVGNTAVPYDLSNAPQNCPSTTSMEVTFTVNNLAVDKYRTYLYYGNPTADNQSTSITSGTPQSPLKDEEHIGVPRQ